MFHKLRLQFILTNLSIIAGLFLILLIGTFLFVNRETKQHPFHMLELLANHICSGKLNDLAPSTDPTFPAPFFAKTDSTGVPYFFSSSNPYSATETTSFIHLIKNEPHREGVIDFGRHSYSFIIRFLHPGSDSLFLFLDTAPQKHGMLMFLGTIFAIGIGCLTLSFLGSLLMAHKAITPIKQSWQQQVDFLADAAHELRTPLSIMQVNLDVVLSNPEETISQQKQWLSNIHEEVKQLSKMVESLFFLAHADSNQQPLEKKEFDLGNALSEAIIPHAQVAQAKQLHLEKDLEEHLLFCGDEFRMKQVINILLDNAIRHAPASGRIRIHLYKQEMLIHVDVMNEGDGIQDKDLEKVFQRFFQVDTARKKGGAGLGLSIAKWIIEAHSGTIKATSIPGHETTFSVCLPS
jgi:signal transduction histidine kinase